MTPGLCLFTDSVAPSGVGEHMLTLAAELHERFRISFVCPPTPQGRPLLQRARAMGLQTLALSVGDEPVAQRTLRDWLHRQRVEIFHGHAGITWEGHDGIYVARAAGVPVVLRTEHLPYLITDPGQRADYHRLVQVVDRLVCVSEGVCVSFREAGVPAHKLRVVRNGINPRPARPDREGVRTRLALPLDARVVLTVARFNEQKGHRYLLDAVPTVTEREPTARFVWVGQGPLEAEFRAQVQQLGLAMQIHFLRSADVAALLAASDLFVLPSLFEGLPLAVLEAMAAGVPVVGTRVCGTSEVIRDVVSGRLVAARDGAALAAAVLEALQQPDRAARWAVAGRDRVKRAFGAARMARETAAIYAELLELMAVAGIDRWGSERPQAVTRDTTEGSLASSAPMRHQPEA